MTAAPAMEYAGIRAVLPHGHGMVLLDRIETLTPGELVAVKSISGGEPCYAHLGPEAPADAYAYPISLLLESFGQAAAVLWLADRRREPDQVLMFVAAKDCRFERPVFPGDVVRHVVRLDHRSDGAAFVSGHSAVGPDRVACYGALTAVVRPRNQLRDRDRVDV